MINLEKNFCVLIFLLICPICGFTQTTTFYFSPIKENAKGQFITFLGDICFESNKYGKSVGHGNLEINQYQSNSTKKVYVGKSYWGSKTKFIFNADKTKLTISTPDDKKYFYIRKTAPAGVKTCTLIRKSNNTGGSYYPSGDNRFSNNHINQGGRQIHNNSGCNSNSSTSVNQPQRIFKCAYCNGTGRIEKNDNAPANFGTKKPRQRCNECGKWYDPNVFVHYHQQCRYCGGIGVAK